MLLCSTLKIIESNIRRMVVHSQLFDYFNKFDSNILFLQNIHPETRKNGYFYNSIQKRSIFNKFINYLVDLFVDKVNILAIKIVYFVKTTNQLY
jgi:hypothetical protein